MKKIAITGGIGSGKSEVLRYIESLGYFVISADNVNALLLNDDKYLLLLKENFIDAFPCGVFDKKILSNIIFNDKEKRLILNSIAHSRIRAIVDDMISKSNANIVFVEVPLLIESGMINMFDEIIVVTANIETKIKRVEKRDNISRDDVLKRISSQYDDSKLLSIATYVIDNDSTIDYLHDKTDKIIDKILHNN